VGFSSSFSQEAIKSELNTQINNILKLIEQ